MPETTHPPLPVPAADPTARPRSMRLILLGVMLAMLLAMLDNVIVGTAMPTIVGELGGLNHLSWVVTAYTLTTAVSTPLWGKFGDLYGRKGIFLGAIVIFLLGSGLSGAAQSMNELIAFRAVQGLGAGGLAVGAFAIIGELVPPRERGRYQGMTATVMALATIGGPLVGGFITQHLGWRWSFYLNLPLGAVALAWCAVMLRLPVKRTKVRVDYLGAGLLAVAITALVLLTTWGGTRYAWGSARILGLGALGAAGVAAFLWSQTRATEPVLPLRLFASRNLSLASVMVLIVGMAMFGAVSFLPLFQQTVQGASAANSGVLLLPMMAPIVLVSQIAGRVMTKTGKYKIFPILGTALISLAFFLLSTMDTDTSRLTAGVYMAVLGAGLGFTMQMTMVIAQNSVEMKDIGVASASSTLFRTLGGSFGVALFGALFSHQIQLGTQAHSGSTGPASVKGAYLHAVASGTHSIFLIGGIISLVAFAVSWFVKETPLRGKPGETRTDNARPAETPRAAEPELDKIQA